MSITSISIARICISPGHNYIGHYGKPSGSHPVVSSDSVELVAGQGIVGDRYFGHKEDFKGQITFFDMAVSDDLAEQLGQTVDPESTRRNVLLRGIDLNTLVGKTFVVQGIRFQGVEECRPCFWMDEAIGGGAEDLLKGRGGLRARILTDGTLQSGDTQLKVLEE